MSTEPEFQAHVICGACGEPIYHGDAIRINGHHVCRPGKCVTPNMAAVTYEYCADCGRIRHVSLCVQIDGAYFCRHCREKHQ